MNIKKGDWVQYKKELSVQGRVIRVFFDPNDGGGYHEAWIGVRRTKWWGVWAAETKALRVIRRGVRHA